VKNSLTFETVQCNVAFRGAFDWERLSLSHDRLLADCLLSGQLGASCDDLQGMAQTLEIRGKSQAMNGTQNKTGENKVKMNLIAAVAAAIVVTSSARADNLAKNGSLATDATAWGTRREKIGVVDGQHSKTIDEEANFTSHLADDGANGTKGCLKISFVVNEDYTKHPSECGAYASIRRIPGSAEAPARAKITFYARCPDKSVAFLRVGRLGAGGDQKVLPLTEEWQKFEFVMSAPYNINGILFSPTDKYRAMIVSGPVLIDEVTVEDVSVLPVKAATPAN